MDFVTYKKFNEKERADGLAEILKENGIAFEITEDKGGLDSLYGGNALTKYYYVKLKKEDFATVDAALLSLSEIGLGDVDKDHYLYGFSDEELFDILSKPDEWNEVDYQLSKRILKERGKEVNNDIVELLKKQRINELSKPEEQHRSWLYAGYIFAMLGGIIGVFIGWHLNTFKKTLPNGQRVYGYSEQDRKHGLRILIIGIIMFIIMMIVRLKTEF